VEAFILPGVPGEMTLMFSENILPRLAARSGGAVILSRTLHTFGLGESAIAERLGELMRRGRNPTVGTTVSGGIVSVRVYAADPTAEDARQHLEETCAACRSALGDLIFGEDEQ